MLVTGSGNSDRFAFSPNVTTNGIIRAVTDLRNINLLSIQLVTTDSTGVFGGSAGGTGLAGAWTVEVSNSYSEQPDQIYGANSSIGIWYDITSSFSPPIPVPSGTSPAMNYPIVMVDVPFRHIRLTFTPTNGNTFVATNKQRAGAFLVGKSNS